MNLDLRLALDAAVLDRVVGVDGRDAPFELKLDDFLGLLNSGESYRQELNVPIRGKNPGHYHITEYRGVEFITHTEKRLYDTEDPLKDDDPERIDWGEFISENRALTHCEDHFYVNTDLGSLVGMF
jgi:hypothetical protein